MLVAFRLYSNPPEKNADKGSVTTVSSRILLVDLFWRKLYLICWDLPKMVHPKLVIDVFLTKLFAFLGGTVPAWVRKYQPKKMP